MSEAKAFDVFSAHAEVVPQQADTSIVLVCILRARGGSPLPMVVIGFEKWYSPHMRR